MLRYQTVFSYVGTCLLLWMGLCWKLEEYKATKSVKEVVHILPMYALICFGAYSLGTIGLSLMAVRDCPEASKELDKQIKEAKEDLRRRGIID